jgi:hypothetical protein
MEDRQVAINLMSPMNAVATPPLPPRVTPTPSNMDDADRGIVTPPPPRNLMSDLSKESVGGKRRRKSKKRASKRSKKSKRNKRR